MNDTITQFGPSAEPDGISGSSGLPEVPIAAHVFAGANSRAYLSALFATWRRGDIAAVLPRAPAMTSMPGVRIVDRHDFTDEPGWFEESFVPIEDDRPALISFSSGTTGRPKALLISHRALADVVERINAAMDVDASIREYIGVPLTYSFGAGRARAVATAGGRSFIPAHGFDPMEIARMLNAGEVNAISAVPTLWRVLLRNPRIIGDAGKHVHWIEIGSQYMSGAEKQALKDLFPQARIVQHYGLTEASRTGLLDVSATEGDALDSVGRAVGNVEVTIGDEGVIRIRGPHLAMGLVTGAGVKPIVDAGGWLTTADVGHIAGGYLYYDGRIDELVNVGGLKVDPAQFEQRLIEEAGAGDALAVGRAPDPLRGERVLVAIEKGAGLDRKAVETAALKVAAELGLVGGGAIELRVVEAIPRTATGKVQRKQLAELPPASIDAASAGPASAHTASPPLPPGPLVQPPTPIASEAPSAGAKRAAELQKLWADVLGVPSVALDQSFYDLGGDSLSALTVIIRMEALGLDPEIARGIFEGRTIAEITGVVSVPTTAAEAAFAVASAGSVSAPAMTSGAEELQRLWAEVLGVPVVALDQSFYDLGGDSLSALTVIIRMEALGLDPEVARGIFEGKTIAEITGATSPPPHTQGVGPLAAAEPSAPAPETVPSGRAAELQALWADVLGVPSVALDQSFYDLGGDSLSALTAIIRMEALGVDPEVARGIFEGRTIAELTGGGAASVPDPVVRSAAEQASEPVASPAAESSKGLTLAQTMNAVHATRGILILWVVVVHWLPGLLGRLMRDPGPVLEALTPVWRFGTPGFAMVFGLGVGALGLAQYQNNPSQFLRGTRFNAVLITSGVLLLALVQFGVDLTAGTLGGAEVPSDLFYSAISFYALAMLTMPLVMRLLTFGTNRLLTIFALMVGAMVIHELLALTVAPLRPGGWLELLKILLTAKYGYFHMMGYVMAGAAMGYLFRANHRRPEMARDLVSAALTLAALGALILYLADPQPLDHFGEVFPWHLMIYAGLALLIMSGFVLLNRGDARDKPRTLRILNALAIASGILALPIFVGHELVIPTSALLGNVGVPGTLALVLPLAVFLAALGFAYWRLMRFLVR